MDEFIISAFVTLVLSSLILWIKNTDRFTSFASYVLFAIILLFTMGVHKDPVAGQKLTATILIVISANWILAQLWKNKWAWILGLVSSFVFFFWKDVQLDFMDYPLIFNAKNALLIPVIAAMFPVLIRFKSSFLSRFFSVDEQQMHRSLTIIGIGMLTLGSYFFASNFGLILAASGYFATEIYLNAETEKPNRGSMVLFLLAFAFIFIKSGGVEVASFLYGSTIIGLFSGLGIAWWISTSDQVPDKAILKKILYFLIPIALIAGLIYLEKIKEHTGGLSAFSGLLVGLSLGVFQLKKSTFALFVSMVSWSMACALFSLPAFQPALEHKRIVKHTKLDDLTTEPEAENQQLPEKQETDTVAKPVAEAKTIEGTWKINSDASKLEFALGPADTRTKGEFTVINGSFKFNKENQLLGAEVSLPLSGFTTFNEFRDEGMMEPGAAHFDAAAFPEISYKAKSAIQKNNSYTLKGEFTMKGISAKMNVPLKLMDQGEDKKGKYLLFVGQSSLDRSKFGMESDPKIGDLVDFNFTIELRLK